MATSLENTDVGYFRIIVLTAQAFFWKDDPAVDLSDYATYFFKGTREEAERFSISLLYAVGVEERSGILIRSLTEKYSSTELYVDEVERSGIVWLSYGPEGHRWRLLENGKKSYEEDEQQVWEDLLS